MTTIQAIEAIGIDPAICHGRPHIVGHRIRVQDVAIWHERLGMNADEIGTNYDLSLSEVYAALSYYFAHKDEIEQAWTADRELLEATQATSSSQLRSRLKVLRGQ